MLEKCFEIICDAIKKNNFLSQNINSYILLEKQTDISYPAIVMENFKQEAVYATNKSLFGLKIEFDVIFISDDYDFVVITKIEENLRNVLTVIDFIDGNIDVKISFNHNTDKKDNAIYEAKYSFSGMIFFKAKFFN